MRAALICFVILLTGCQPFIYDAGPDMTLEQVKAQIDARFEYRDQHFRYTPGATGEAPFVGNCVNYSDAALYQLRKLGLPAQQWFVLTETHELHMITCSGDSCLDNRRRLVVRRESLPYRWLEVVQLVRPADSTR